jgi:hypothetical protein
VVLASKVASIQTYLVTSPSGLSAGVALIDNHIPANLVDDRRSAGVAATSGREESSTVVMGRAMIMNKSDYLAITTGIAHLSIQKPKFPSYLPHLSERADECTPSRKRCRCHAPRPRIDTDVARFC